VFVSAANWASPAGIWVHYNTGRLSYLSISSTKTFLNAFWPWISNCLYNSNDIRFIKIFCNTKSQNSIPTFKCSKNIYHSFGATWVLGAQVHWSSKTHYSCATVDHKNLSSKQAEITNVHTWDTQTILLHTEQCDPKTIQRLSSVNGSFMMYASSITLQIINSVHD